MSEWRNRQIPEEWTGSLYGVFHLKDEYDELVNLEKAVKLSGLKRWELVDYLMRNELYDDGTIRIWRSK